MVLAILLIMRGIKRLFSAQFFFVLLIIAIALWSLSLGVSEATESTRVSDYFGRATYGFSGLVLYLSYVSVLLLAPHSERYRKKRIKWASLLSFILLPLFFTRFVYSVPDVTTFTYGPGIVLYALYMVGAIGLVMRQATYTSRQGTAEQKGQVRLVAGGLGLMISLVGLMNVVIPAVTGNESFTILSPIVAVSYSAIIVYAIARHKLFDIRLIVARSVAYILSLAFLGLLYGFIAFYFFDRVLFEIDASVSPSRRLLYVSLALVSGLSFAPAKRMFDRLSNRIFYRDAYDAQAFIDNLTGVLVSNTDITKLIEESSALIDRNLKPVFTEFVLHDKRFTGGKIARALPENVVSELFEVVQEEAQSVIELEDEEALRKPEYRRLHKRGVAIIIKLANRSGLLGVVLIGVKQSGNVYNKQDKKIFGIVADELALAIENSLSYEEIERFNDTLQQEIEDATRQLRYTNAKLKSLDETKDEFISMASHQLRTPLTSVKGYVSMVLEGDAGNLNDQQKKLLSQAFTSAQHMNYLISDLLNVSRLRTGKFVIETKPTFLPDVIEGEISQLYEIARAKGVELRFDKPADFPTVELDETKVRQIIMNFTDNAVHYTPAGGKVRVELEAKPRSIEFRVIDTGLGVPRRDQHKLFGKFFRAENAKRARPDGTGLGLFMAKKVIVAQGGSIIFKSVEGKGSTFGFTFPLGKKQV